MKKQKTRQFQPVWKVAALAALTGFIINFCSTYYLDKTWWALPTVLGLLSALAVIVLYNFVKGQKHKTSFMNSFRNESIPFFARNLMLLICLVGLAIQALNFIPIRGQATGDYFLMDKARIRTGEKHQFIFNLQGLNVEPDQEVTETVYRQYERGDIVPVVLQTGLFGGVFVKHIGQEEPNPALENETESVDVEKVD